MVCGWVEAAIGLSVVDRFSRWLVSRFIGRTPGSLAFTGSRRIEMDIALRLSFQWDIAGGLLYPQAGYSFAGEFKAEIQWAADP